MQCIPGHVWSTVHKNCSSCPAGQAASNVVAPCADCTIGKYQSQNAAAAYNCKLCIAGQYADQTTQTVCKSCVEGKYSVGIGTTSIVTCKNCQPGKFALPGVGQGIECKNCIAGKHNNLEQQLENGCISCKEGKYSVGIGMTSIATCKNCLAGKFALPGVGQGIECKNCTAGKYNNLEQQLEVSCKFCVVGMVSVGAGNVLCQICVAGKFGDNIIGQSTECKNCLAGKYNNLEQQLEVGCKICVKAKYAVGGNPLCTSCAAGKFSDVGPGQPSETAACKICDQGQYSNDTGITECKLCPMGKNLIEEGTALEHDHFSDCKDCPKQQVSFICYPSHVFMVTLKTHPFLSRFLLVSFCLAILLYLPSNSSMLV